jgi:hypothetical protein
VIGATWAVVKTDVDVLDFNLQLLSMDLAAQFLPPPETNSSFLVVLLGSERFYRGRNSRDEGIASLHCLSNLCKTI